MSVGTQVRTRQGFLGVVVRVNVYFAIATVKLPNGRELKSAVEDLKVA